MDAISISHGMPRYSCNTAKVYFNQSISQFISHGFPMGF